MIETRQLQIFKAIIDAGSITGAGDLLALSQPAISQHVRALEERLGVSLLVRAGRRARPTPAGEVLARYAGQILQKVEAVEREIGDRRNGHAGLLRLGVDAQCGPLLAAVLAELRRLVPRLDLRITTGHAAPLTAGVTGRHIDVAIVALPVAGERLRVVEVSRAALVAILPPEHPLAVGRAWVAAPDLAPYPFALYDRSSRLTEATLAFLLEAGVFPRSVVEVDDLEALKDMVHAGIGIAIVPETCARRDVADGRVRSVPLGPAPVSAAFGIVYSESQPAPLVLRKVVDVCAATLPQLFARDETRRASSGGA